MGVRALAQDGFNQDQRSGSSTAAFWPSRRAVSRKSRLSAITSTGRRVLQLLGEERQPERASALLQRLSELRGVACEMASSHLQDQRPRARRAFHAEMVVVRRRSSRVGRFRHAAREPKTRDVHGEEDAIPSSDRSSTERISAACPRSSFARVQALWVAGSMS